MTAHPLQGARPAGRASPAPGLALAVLGAALAASILVAVGVGTVPIPVEEVAGIVIGKLLPGAAEPSWSAAREAIVWEIRLPRALLGALVGAGLALVGAVLQAATRNPLADPHLLGVSSGAALGAIVALLHTGLILGLATVPAFAFLGALGATALVLAVSRATGSTTPGRLVLTGVAVSFVVMSAANFLVFLGDPRAAHTVVFWMLGGLGLARWSHLAFPAAALALCGAHLLACARRLDAMTLGDETAATLGVPVTALRLQVFAISALLTGTMVAFSGVIGFVGLMVPHIVRLAAGGANRRVLPLSMLAGAVFLTWADIAARTLMPPQDVPIGVVTGLAGGCFLILLLGRRRAA